MWSGEEEGLQESNRGDKYNQSAVNVCVEILRRSTNSILSTNANKASMEQRVADKREIAERWDSIVVLLWSTLVQIPAGNFTGLPYSKIQINGRLTQCPRSS